MSEWLSVSWKMLVLRGVVGIVFGIIAMAWPITTALALVVMWGFWALFDGIGAIAQAFQHEVTGGQRVLLVVMGALALVAAFFAFVHPFSAAVALTWILGIWLIVRGVFELFGAFSTRRTTPRWLLLLGGGLSLVAGIIFAANPGASAVAIAVWLGIVALAWGIAFVVTGFVVRSGLKTLEESGAEGTLAG